MFLLKRLHETQDKQIMNYDNETDTNAVSRCEVELKDQRHRSFFSLLLSQFKWNSFKHPFTVSSQPSNPMNLFQNPFKRRFWHCCHGGLFRIKPPPIHLYHGYRPCEGHISLPTPNQIKAILLWNRKGLRQLWGCIEKKKLFCWSHCLPLLLLSKSYNSSH